LIHATLFNKESHSKSRRIATNDANEAKYVPRHLGVSQEELLRVVDKVGNSTSTVRKELGK
jgi:hypothetical protein